MKRLIIQDYYNAALMHCFRWLGSELPTTGRTKTLWECVVCGERVERCYDDMRRHRVNCKNCGNPGYLRFDLIHEIEKEMDITWVPKHPFNKKSKVDFICALGHIFSIKLNHYWTIRSQADIFCPDCRQLQRSVSIARWCQDVCESNGWVWLGGLPDTKNDYTTYKCSCGYKGKKVIYSLNESDCPQCSLNKVADNQRLNIEDYHALAQSCGLTFLEKSVPKTTHTLCLWCCDNGHILSRRYDDVKRYPGCYRCNKTHINGVRVSQPQLDLASILNISEDYINYPFNGFYLDMVILSDKLCIEYDGWPWHDPEKDKERDQELIASGWKVLRVKSSSLLPTKKQLNAALNMLRNGSVYEEIVLSDWKETAL